MINIYTDGAALGNPGPGGYGIIMTKDAYTKEFSEGFRMTTNNRMELLAVIVALEKIKLNNADVTVFTDSKYVADAVNKGWLFDWQRKGFAKQKNPDLWKRFLEIYKKHNVRFVWIKGHAGHKMNERCDELAVLAAKTQSNTIDKYYEDFVMTSNP